ncbi:hypothetical protein RSW49_22845 [Escherichia coli]|nr:MULTISPECIES: hypothetical protein [Enterobacteriaceae]MDT9105788.1 hypothetical protein [Escherichia coli]
MKIAIIIVAALLLSVIIAMAFPGATIWQVALVPAIAIFSAIAFNFRKGN